MTRRECFRSIDSERASIGVSRKRTCRGTCVRRVTARDASSPSPSGCGITFAAINQALPSRRSADGGLEVRRDGDNSRTD